jgi:hypothetical protein
MRAIFLRVPESKDKAAALLNAVQQQALGSQRFEVDPQMFEGIPRSPFAYWVSANALRAFSSEEPFQNQDRLVVSTNPLNDDFRYVRSWWEVPAKELRVLWMPWAKGGSYSPIYYDIDSTIRWDSVRLTYAGFLGTENRPLERPASVQHFFRAGLTWPRRTLGGLGLRAMPRGCVFADKGPAAFVAEDEPEHLLALLAVTTSAPFRLLVELQMAVGSYEVGVIQRTPVPHLNSDNRQRLAALSGRAWSLKRSLDASTECSHAFTLPALLQVAGADVASRVELWSQHVRAVVAELGRIEVEIDEHCFSLYGFDDADRRAVAEDFTCRDTEDVSEGAANDIESDTGQEGKLFDVVADSTRLATELVSWAVGVSFGRFDVRAATGAREAPRVPEPFDPLPVCSPGMLTGDDGLPLVRAPLEYRLACPDNGIFVDDPGHAQDLTTAVRAVFDVVFRSDADRWWDDVAKTIDPKEHELRGWLAGSYFEHHMKCYSKSRRKAPIFWQLSIPSGRYSVWLCAHRLTRDSFFQLQNDVVGPKLIHEERQLNTLVRQSGRGPSSSERREITNQETLVEELRAMHEEVRRIAPLWNPKLDDGVVLTMAPLWRLAYQHRSWQKELKNKWDGLCAGQYDWAHFAMHLWPERVVRKCAMDRSLAIAHDLEDIFWSEGRDGKWAPRPTPTRPIEELVQERTSNAVKSALRSHIEAPVANANGVTRRGSRASHIASEEGAI